MMEFQELANIKDIREHVGDASETNKADEVEAEEPGKGHAQRVNVTTLNV